MQIKAAFFDIDGTLLSHKLKAVPQSALDTIEQMQKKGILCVAATGRSIMEFNRLPTRGIRMDGYIALNGQLVLDQNQEILSAHPLEDSARNHLLKLFNEKDIPVLLIEKDRLYINKIDDQVRAANKAVSTPLPPVDSWSGNPVYSAIGYIPKEKEEELHALLPEFTITRWCDQAVDLLRKGGSKQAGIEEFLKFHTIRPEETIAFGDGENDLEMLQHAGIGVAMGNAKAIIKENADYVTEDVKHDGIQKAALHFGLID